MNLLNKDKRNVGKTEPSWVEADLLVKLKKKSKMKHAGIAIITCLLLNCSNGDKKRDDYPDNNQKKEHESEKKISERDSIMSPETHTR